jgi:hypothetical protein
MVKKCHLTTGRELREDIGLPAGGRSACSLKA